jgi:Transcriptional regulator
MFQPAAFREDDLDAQLALVRAHPLGLLVSHGEQGLTADPLPFLADVEQGQIRLRAHLSRANEHWRRLQNAAECLVIFQGLEGYVSPGWYPSKRQTGKVVPTWNYSMVQLYGVPTVMDDPAWLRRQLIDLTAQQEGAPPGTLAARRRAGQLHRRAVKRHCRYRDRRHPARRQMEDEPKPQRRRCRRGDRRAARWR